MSPANATPEPTPRAMAGRAPGRLRALATRHPVGAFVLLTLAWSWSIWSLLFLWGGQGVLTKGPPAQAFAVAAAGGCGPSLSGLFLTWWTGGPGALRQLGARLRQWRVGGWWLALLFIPCVTALTPALRALAGHPQDGQAMLELLPTGLAIGLGAGLMEEIGWRGYLLPQLLKRHSALVSSLIVGGVWGGLWHGYANYFGIGAPGPTLCLLILLLGPGMLTAWSLVLTRLHQRTGGSLLVAVLMHASISSSAFVLGQKFGDPAEELPWTAVSVGIALMAATLLWAALRPAAQGKPRSTY